MKLDISDIVIMLENNCDRIINGLFQLQITKPNEVSLFLKEHNSDNLISLQDKLNEKIDLIISNLSEEGEPVPPPPPPNNPPPQNIPPPPPPNNNYPGGYHHHHGGYGFLGPRFRFFNADELRYRFRRFRNRPHEYYHRVQVRNTPDTGGMSAFDLYMFISNKFKQFRRLYSKYKSAKTNDDVEMINYYSDKLKDIKQDIVSANNKLRSKIENMSAEEKKEFASKRSKVAKQMKIVNKFKE